MKRGLAEKKSPAQSAEGVDDARCIHLGHF